jgi:hypothetical protein
MIRSIDKHERIIEFKMRKREKFRLNEFGAKVTTHSARSGNPPRVYRGLNESVSSFVNKPD